MTPPREKAIELYEKFIFPCWECNEFDTAKQSALIAVDEVLDFILIELKWDKKYNGNVIYWNKVKQEIWLIT